MIAQTPVPAMERLSRAFCLSFDFTANSSYLAVLNIWRERTHRLNTGELLTLRPAEKSAIVSSRISFSQIPRSPATL